MHRQVFALRMLLEGGHHEKSDHIINHAHILSSNRAKQISPDTSAQINENKSRNQGKL